jgi:hypothetical protein
VLESSTREKIPAFLSFVASRRNQKNQDSRNFFPDKKKKEKKKKKKKKKKKREGKLAHRLPPQAGQIRFLH